MNTVALPDGTLLPALGLGTWHMGEAAARRTDDVAAVRCAIDIGYRVIDTAEMYADGGAEQVVGQGVAQALRAGAVTREQLFIVSKVTPHNASRAGMAAACERSRKRLMLDHIDLYLLHWPGPHPLRETVAAFEALQADGHIRHWGVSNFDTDDLRELTALPGGARTHGGMYLKRLGGAQGAAVMDGELLFRLQGAGLLGGVETARKTAGNGHGQQWARGLFQQLGVGLRRRL